MLILSSLPDWWPYDKPYAIMDCLEGMMELPDKCVDLVLTDPPYGINIASKGIIGGVGKSGKHNRVNNYGKIKWDDKIPSDDLFKEMFRVSKNQIIFGYNYFTNILGPTNNLIVWDKKCQNDWNDNFSDGELAWTSFKRPLKIYRYLFMGCNGNNEITRGERVHPTQKPIPLFIWILNNYSKPGDIVLDMFLGSGTTLRACRETGRVGLGFEIEPDYEPIIRKRMMEDIPKLDEWF